MEPWNHGAQGKTVSPHGMIARCKDTLVDSHSRTCTFGENMFVSGRESVCNESFCEVNFPGMTGKQLCINSVGDVLGGRRTENRMMSISSASEFVESNSRMSRSIVEEDAKREALLIDLKLGGFPDHRDVYRPNFSRGIPMAFSPDLSTPPKRARAGGESLQTIYCQVHGCNKDLSSSKDYHKRHKVCEVHSKTSKVIVNGIEQRFCQQCSRFHLLSEFDDGKRSCRKRLAGHNERRRKPQVGIRSGRTGRILQSYNGGRFQGSALPAESFICRDLLPGRLLHSDKYGLNDLCRQVKVEEETNYCSLSAIRNINGVLDSNSIFSYGYDKQFSNFNVNGTKTAAASIFGDGTSQYQSDLQSSKVSGSLFQETSIGNNEYNIFDTASTIRGLPGIPDSQCALSLLSSQSRNSSSHSAGHPVGRSVILGNMHSGSKASSIGLPRKLPSSALSPKGKTDLDPLLISDGHEVNFQIANEIGQGSKFTSSKQSLSCEDSPTIKLLQLSSQLQRVEHQKQFMQAKQDSDTFCFKRIT